MPRFRKKPVEIDALVWNGRNQQEVHDFTGGIAKFAGDSSEGWGQDFRLTIPTLEGDHHAAVGDVIIRGVQGEFYPCKPDIFEQTYEAV